MATLTPYQRTLIRELCMSGIIAWSSCDDTRDEDWKAMIEQAWAKCDARRDEMLEKDAYMLERDGEKRSILPRKIIERIGVQMGYLLELLP